MVKVKNITEQAKHHSNNKKTTQSALNIIVTIRNNTERAKHYRNNQKQHSAR